jgi:hypothetical protein
MRAASPIDMPTEVTEEHNAGRRSELAADWANRTLDDARDDYGKGDPERGDLQLGLVGKLVDECWNATVEANRSKYYKKSELKMAMLAKRVRALKDDLNYDRQDKAEQLAQQIDSIHDKLLAGVMGK